MAGWLSSWPRQLEAQGLLLPEGGDAVCCPASPLLLFMFSAKQLGISFWQGLAGMSVLSLYTQASLN